MSDTITTEATVDGTVEGAVVEAGDRPTIELVGQADAGGCCGGGACGV
ncbi:MAG: hypothetical protein ABIO33_06195 [Leifsonia sp.]